MHLSVFTISWSFVDIFSSEQIKLEGVRKKSWQNIYHHKISQTLKKMHHSISNL